MSRPRRPFARPDDPRRRFGVVHSSSTEARAPMSDTLDRVLRAFGAPGTRAVRTIFTTWDDLVGPEIGAHCRPAILERGVLVVAVDAPAWATRFRYEQAAVLARIAEELGPDTVRRIEVKVRARPAEEPS